jgi:hypothetical protein
VSTVTSTACPGVWFHRQTGLKQVPTMQGFPHGQGFESQPCLSLMASLLTLVSFSSGKMEVVHETVFKGSLIIK